MGFEHWDADLIDTGRAAVALDLPEGSPHHFWRDPAGQGMNFGWGHGLSCRTLMTLNNREAVRPGAWGLLLSDARVARKRTGRPFGGRSRSAN